MISSGSVDHPVPRQLSKEELKGITKRFVDGAKNALAAGFDGALLGWLAAEVCYAAVIKPESGADRSAQSKAVSMLGRQCPAAAGLSK